MLAQQIEPWRLPLALADHGVTALQYSRHHPGWVAGGIALLIALRPGRAAKWLARDLLTWQMVNKLRAMERKPEESG